MDQGDLFYLRRTERTYHGVITELAEAERARKSLRRQREELGVRLRQHWQMVLEQAGGEERELLVEGYEKLENLLESQIALLSRENDAAEIEGLIGELYTLKKRKETDLRLLLPLPQKIAEEVRVLIEASPRPLTPCQKMAVVNRARFLHDGTVRRGAIIVCGIARSAFMEMTDLVPIAPS